MSEPLAPHPVQRWKATALARTVLWGIGTCLAACGLLAPFLIEPQSASNLLFTPPFLAFAAVFVHLGSGYVELYPDQVVIDGLFRRRREIPLSRLIAVEPDTYGLYFRTVELEGVSGPDAVGAKGFLLHVLRVRNRGDLIASTIMEAATALNRSDTSTP